MGTEGNPARAIRGDRGSAIRLLARPALVVALLTLSAATAATASAMPVGAASSSASPARHRDAKSNGREETTFRFEFGAGVHVEIRGGGEGTSRCTHNETVTSFTMTKKVETRKVGFDVESGGACGAEASFSQFRVTVTRGNRTIGTGIVAFGEVGLPFGRYDSFCDDYVTGERILHGLTCDIPSQPMLVISAPGAQGGDGGSCDIVSSPTSQHHTECADVNLNGRSLVGKDLRWANLAGANLSWADISRSALEHANLKGANLAHAFVPGAKFSDTDMSGSRLVDIQIEAGAFDTFDRANLVNADLASADLEGASMRDAQLKGVMSGGIHGRPASLPSNWALLGGYLIGPDANLANARLDGLELRGHDLRGVTSGGVTGTPKTLPEHWVLLNGYLIGPEANLMGAKLTYLDASRADFSRADLTAADLRGSRVNPAAFTGTKWDRTICPDGTTSEHHGGTCARNLSFWSRVSFHLNAVALLTRPCGGTSFGEVGTQVCEGVYDERPGPDPSFGAWPFTDKHNGTSKASVATRGGEVTLRFYVHGGEIDGTMPGANSNRYSVTRAIIGNVAPAFSNPVKPGTPAGERDGPLKIIVSDSSPQSGYQFDVEGWVLVP